MDEDGNDAIEKSIGCDADYPSPAKRPRLCNDDVFLAPIGSLTPPPAEYEGSSIHLQNNNSNNNNNDKMQILLPKVPCISPTSMVSNVSSSSTLTAHLLRPPLNIPSLSLDASHKLLEMPSENNMSISMRDISELITKNNILSNSVPLSYSFLQNTFEPKTIMSNSQGVMASLSQVNSIKLPINLSTLVPVSKQSLNMDGITLSTAPPMPTSTSSNVSSILGIKQKQHASPFSLSSLQALSPLLPTISPQIQTTMLGGPTISELSSSTNLPSVKESKPSSNTNKRGRSMSNAISSSATLVWPGVDAVVDSYRKYNHGKS